MRSRISLATSSESITTSRYSGTNWPIRELGEANSLKVLSGLALRRQKALEEEAFSVGARLFAEPADSLTGRWRSYWEAWRIDVPREAALAA